MDYKYEYPRVTDGYNFNMLMLIKKVVGIQPMGMGSNNTTTFIHFDRELTVQEKTDLDAVMAGDPTHAPTPSGSLFKIKDLWEFREQLKAEMLLDFDIYYSESIPGSGVFDMIELHFATNLTNQEKNRVVSAYQNSISFVL